MVVTAADVINSLFNPQDKVCLRVFDDKKRGIFKGKKFEIEAGKFATLIPTLEKHNAQMHGVFYTVNFGGQEDSDITRINAQFVEIDDKSFDEQIKLIDAFPLKPSMIIKTRKSLHTYWFMDSSAKVSRFREIQKALAEYFGGDKQIINESRVMRLPGFNHCKEEPVMVDCILFHPERKYSQDQLAEFLPIPKKKEEPKPELVGVQKGLGLVRMTCDFIQHCEKDAANLSECEWYAMITNLAPFEGGADLIHKLSEPYPGYSKEETQAKIQHFLESSTRPMHCRTIAEKGGFVCPKMGTRDCACKSPAGRSHIPADTDTLVKLIKELPRTDNQLEDYRIAESFVKNWLYNVEPSTSFALISFELKYRFDFKQDSIRSLSKLAKTLYAEHQVNQAYLYEKSQYDLPDWYVIKKTGDPTFRPGILAQHMAKEKDTFYAPSGYYNYEDGVYKQIDDLTAKGMVQALMIPEYTHYNQIVDAESQWRVLINKAIKDINPNPYIINVRNGLYNILEDTLTDHTPDYYSTIQLNIKYDTTADCPLFKQFLKDSMDGDMEQVALIQEMLGYSLIPVNTAQKCFVIVGVADAGKSVLLRVLNEVLLGKENVSNVSWQSLNERFKTAELYGKLANIFADLPTKNIDDNGVFKALVGEDYLTVEKKNKNPFSFQSTAKLIFSCNSIPRNYGDKSEGFYRRLIIIRFNHVVPKNKRDPFLIDKLKQEADGIFIFALEGLHRLMQNHYVFSETQVNKKELEQYREESDSVLSFVHDYCELTADGRVGSTELFVAYKSYCEECGLKPYSQKAFVQQIMVSYPRVRRDIDRIAKRRILIGIKLGEVLA